MSTGLARKVTAVATAGQMGQLFTVYEKNWFCKDCNQENYASRSKCSRCRKAKPVGEVGNYVEDAALAAMQSRQEISWQEVIDPVSRHLYYYNKDTGETQWERPTELGATPLASGWFGRGQAGSNAAQKFAALNDLYLSRPARKQKDFIDPKKYHTEGSNEFNIWFGRYLGDGPENGRDKDPAPDRCVLETDAGFTKADAGGKERKERRVFCIHFARGSCAKGSDCSFYHRIPTPEDDAKCDEMFDCFGRQKHNSHKDDMSGVGSFMKPSRTLFVGNLNKQSYETPKALEEAAWKHFSEWGELETCNVIHRLSICFPRYRLRTSAEFAKEAMSQQALDHKEILSIRWARDDPNPVAQDAINRADKDALAALLKARGVSLEKTAFEYPLGYQVPDSKRARLDGSVNDELAVAYPEIAYPNTDSQYASVTGPVGGEAAAAAAAAMQYAEYNEAYYASLYGTVVPQVFDSSVSVSASASSSSSGAISEYDLARLKSSFLSSIDSTSTSALPAAAVSAAAVSAAAVTAVDPSIPPAQVLEVPAELGAGWTAHVDQDTGATYYFNAQTGESSWGVAPQEEDSDEEEEVEEAGAGSKSK